MCIFVSFYYTAHAVAECISTLGDTSLHGIVTQERLILLVWPRHTFSIAILI